MFRGLQTSFNNRTFGCASGVDFIAFNPSMTESVDIFNFLCTASCTFIVDSTLFGTSSIGSWNFFPVMFFTARVISYNKSNCIKYSSLWTWNCCECKGFVGGGINSNIMISTAIWTVSESMCCTVDGYLCVFCFVLSNRKNNLNNIIRYNKCKSTCFWRSASTKLNTTIA